MIYTVTVNPSIDYIVQLKNLTLGEVNRMDYDNKLPGGGHQCFAHLERARRGKYSARLPGRIYRQIR